MILFAKETAMIVEKAGINMRDAKYLELYIEYLQRCQQGEKKTYIYEVLAEKYGLCVRSVYYVKKRFEKYCNRDAV